MNKEGCSLITGNMLMVYKLEYFRNSKCSKTEWAVYDDFIYDWMLFDDDDDDDADDGIRWQKNWVVPCIRLENMASDFTQIIRMTMLFHCNCHVNL